MARHPGGGAVIPPGTQPIPEPSKHTRTTHVAQGIPPEAEGVILRAFGEFVNTSQWVTWRLETRDRKPTKVPYAPRSARKTGPDAGHVGDWGTLSDALGAMRRRRHHGVGLVLPEGLVCVDLDRCTTEPFGPLEPWAREIVERLDTFTEYSPSGTGVHVWLRGAKPGTKCRRGTVEIYGGPYGRYITVTGRGFSRWGESGIAERTHALGEVYAQHLDTPRASAAPLLASIPEPTSIPVNTVVVAGRVHPSALTDDEILHAAREARGVGGAITALWHGAPSALAEHGDDQSVAEAALATRLVWWCGGDVGRAERLMSNSPLCAREKWQTRADYRARTMALAASHGKAWDGPSRRQVMGWFGEDRALALFGPKSARTGPKVIRADDRPSVGATARGDDPRTSFEADPASVPTPTPPPASVGPHAGPDGYALTDLGNAERLMARAGARLVWNPATETWMWWNGSLWEPSAGHRAEREASEMARRLWADALALAGEEDRRTLRRHASRSEGRRAITDALALARSLDGVRVEPGEVDADPAVIVVNSGVVDLGSGTISRHDPGRLLTRGVWHLQPDGRRILAHYRPGVTPISHPLWDTFLTEVQPDPEVRAYLQRLAGLSLSGWTRDAFHVHVGTGANGKSTFLDTLRRAIGSDYSHVAPLDAVMARRADGNAPTPGVADLHGRRFVVVSEADAGDRLAEATVKAITSQGEPVTARRLHGNPFTFSPTHTLHLHSNHRPIVRGTDDGIWRRLHLIPWDVTIPEDRRDDGLKARLSEPDVLLGVLAWAVAGAQELCANGLQPPAAVTNATRTYRAESDALGQWLDERCEIGPNLGPTSGGELHADYRTWCEANGHRPVASNTFGERLRGVPGVERPTATGRERRSWRGISLVS